MNMLESMPTAKSYIRVLKERKLTEKVTVEEVQLLLGTCATESDFGKYRKQIKGPARGIFQIEPFTGCDLIDRVLKSSKYKHVYDWVLSCMLHYTPGNKTILGNCLTHNDELSIILCRTKYLTDKKPIPQTLEGIAKTWKRVYNTHLGKGKVDDFIIKYNKYVGNFNYMNEFIYKNL